MQYYTLLQVCDMLQVHPTTVARWIQRGELKATRLNKRRDYRITEEAISDFIKSKRVGDKND